MGTSDRVKTAIAGVLAGAALDPETRERLARELGEALGNVCEGPGLGLDLEPIELDLASLDWTFADDALANWSFDNDLGEALDSITEQALAQLTKEPETCLCCGQPLPSKSAT